MIHGHVTLLANETKVFIPSHYCLRLKRVRETDIQNCQLFQLENIVDGGGSKLMLSNFSPFTL